MALNPKLNVYVVTLNPKVMGANASGKSNLLKALDYMWMFVRPH